jgi:2'-5' RNA ligase
MRLIYNKMWDNALQAFENDELQFDPFTDDSNDLRRGITLLIKPCEGVQNAFGNFIEEVKSIEPQQYFYKFGEVHVTVLSIINCFDGFNLSHISLPEYIKTIENSLKKIKTFKIEFVGLTASPSCILVQGFPENNMLDILRTNLRIEFKRSSLYNSIDKRYKIKTAHCTLIRFKDKLNNKNILLNFLKKNRNKYFGKTSVTELELTYTDWYHKNEIVRALRKFKL